jgi:hypothetical protein
MMRAGIVVLLLLAIGCGDDNNGPAVNPAFGIWKVTAIGGDPLPASSLNASSIGGVPITVTGGVLNANEGGPWWETCLDDGFILRSHFNSLNSVAQIDDQRARLFYHNEGAGTYQPDTLTVTGTTATLRYRESFTASTSAELWTLERIGDVGDDVPNACEL